MPFKDLEKKRAWQKRRNLMFSQMRAAGVDVARFILREARRSDTLRGHICDPTRAEIEQLIGSGCSYCGETALRMTLDRIDNARGHTRDNVAPACICCNYARRTQHAVRGLALFDGRHEESA